MGLEALVESYAFWRPSLRTLTFEDIPGMAKQGRDNQQDPENESVVCHGYCLGTKSSWVLVTMTTIFSKHTTKNKCYAKGDAPVKVFIPPLQPSKEFCFFPKTILQSERQLLFVQPQEEDNRRVILLNFFQEDPIQHFYLRTPIMIPQVSVDTKRLTRD